MLGNANASPNCPTKSEAREKYEDARIYWHSDMHCWDNRRTNSRDWPHVPDPKEEPKVATALDVWNDPPAEKTIWPDPPAKFDTQLMETSGTISPLRWWYELIEFGKAKVKHND